MAKRPKKPTWTKQSLKLKPNHQWKTKPGYRIFVADRGAVRFDFPEKWVVVPGTDSIKLHDRQPPDDDCTLQISVMYLNPEIDWDGLTMGPMVRKLVENDSRDIRERSPVQEAQRFGIDLAWAEIRFLDPNENREAFGRTCLARKGTIQPLITFDFWADDAARCIPVWDEVLRSLRLGEYIEDPTFGYARRG